MPRRLVTRTAPASQSTHHRQSSQRTSLPPYQSPSCHHSPYQRLSDLTTRSALSSASFLKRQLQESGRHLAHSADDLQSRLRERRAKLAQIRKRRHEKQTEKTPEEEKLEEHVEKLEGLVKELTEKSESAMRGVVDTTARMADEAQVLKDLEAEFTNRRPPPRPQDGEEDTPTPEEGPFAVYTSLRTRKQTEYTSLPAYERYALNNDYITFKKLLHLGLVGEDGPPLPDASRWFDPRGNPVLGITAAGGDGSGEEDGHDEDVAVAREVVSLGCPLTLSVMREPYSNRKCKHTFERAAIQQYLRDSGTAECPQTGCAQTFTYRDFKDDFYLDETMLRRIEHANEAETRKDYDDSRMYDDDDEDENLISDTSGLPGASHEEEPEVPRGARSGSRVPKKERMSLAR